MRTLESEPTNRPPVTALPLSWPALPQTIRLLCDSHDVILIPRVSTALWMQSHKLSKERRRQLQALRLKEYVVLLAWGGPARSDLSLLTGGA